MQNVLRLGATVTCALAVLLLLQCNLKPKEGASCSAPQGTCLSSEDALFCVGLDIRKGTYQKLRCLGPDGCKQGRLGAFTCDTTLTDVGTACPESLQGKSACSADKKSMLLCDFRVWALQGKCLGPKGCTSDTKNVRCDESIGAEGDACSEDGKMACAADGKRRLVCKGMKMTPGNSCDGTAGCHVDGEDVLCDGPGEIEGAPCEPEGSAGCENDGKTHLACKGGVMVEPVPCRGANGCTRSDTGLFCDRSIAAEGEPCLAEGVLACSADGAAMLTCKGGSFAAARACHAPCKVLGKTGLGDSYRIDCR